MVKQVCMKWNMFNIPAAKSSVLWSSGHRKDIHHPCRLQRLIRVSCFHANLQTFFQFITHLIVFASVSATCIRHVCSSWMHRTSEAFKWSGTRSRPFHNGRQVQHDQSQFCFETYVHYLTVAQLIRIFHRLAESRAHHLKSSFLMKQIPWLMPLRSCQHFLSLFIFSSVFNFGCLHLILNSF